METRDPQSTVCSVSITLAKKWWLSHANSALESKRVCVRVCQRNVNTAGCLCPIECARCMCRSAWHRLVEERGSVWTASHECWHQSRISSHTASRTRSHDILFPPPCLRCLVLGSNDTGINRTGHFPCPEFSQTGSPGADRQTASTLSHTRQKEKA